MSLLLLLFVGVARRQCVRCMPRDRDISCHLSTATCTLKAQTSLVVCAQSATLQMWYVDRISSFTCFLSWIHYVIMHILFVTFSIYLCSIAIEC